MGKFIGRKMAVHVANGFKAIQAVNGLDDIVITSDDVQLALDIGELIAKTCRRQICPTCGHKTDVGDVHITGEGVTCPNCRK